MTANPCRCANLNACSKSRDSNTAICASRPCAKLSRSSNHTPQAHEFYVSCRTLCLGRCVESFRLSFIAYQGDAAGFCSRDKCDVAVDCVVARRCSDNGQLRCGVSCSSDQGHGAAGRRPSDDTAVRTRLENSGKMDAARRFHGHVGRATDALDRAPRNRNKTHAAARSKG